jgi:hypothetical protein
MYKTTIDYLPLGQTVPEESKKYGLSVCTAGIDLKTNQLVRVYPLAVRSEQHFKRWQVVKDLPVRRNPNDNRPESWRLDICVEKLKDYKTVNYPTKRRKDIIREFSTSNSVNELNEERKSLALVKINNAQGYFESQSKKTVNVRQFCLFDDYDVDAAFGKKEFKVLPRIKWTGEKGCNHDYMFNSWDAYMHQIKLADQYGIDNLWDAVGLKNKDKYALIGNMNKFRKSWLIISLF